MDEITITDEMVALEVVRLTNGAISEGEARKFAAELRNQAITRGNVDYNLKFDEFVNQHIRPMLPRNGAPRRLGKKNGPAKEVPKVRLNNWHAFVATPAYDDRVLVQYAQSMTESAYCCPLYQVQITASMMANGAFIDLARNIYVRLFLEEFPDCTHLFFIDSDLKWEPRAFIGLIRADLPIVAGIYPRRQADEDYPVKFMEHPEKGGMWVENVDGIDFFMAERVPTGFLCIRRDIVEEMAKDAVQLDIHGQPSPVPQLFETKLDYEGTRWDGTARFVGEDYAFSDKYVAKYGKPIHVYPDINFVHGSAQIGKEGNLLKWVAEDIERQHLEAAGEDIARGM